MTNIEQVRKLYTQLKADERFALLVSAAGRNDPAEIDALVSSAPKLHFGFPHTQGLSDGFTFLTSWHMVQQLGTAGIFWMLSYWQDGEKPDDETETIATIEGRELGIGDAKVLVARRFLEGLEAYNAVCKEYGLEPEQLEKVYQGYEMLLAMTELIVRQAFDITQTKLIDLEARKQDYRQVIERCRAQWAEEDAKFD